MEKQRKESKKLEAGGNIVVIPFLSNDYVNKEIDSLLIFSQISWANQFSIVCSVKLIIAEMSLWPSVCINQLVIHSISQPVSQVYLVN